MTPAVKHAVWLLTQIPIAAKQEDFASVLRTLGLKISDRPSLIEVAAAKTEGTVKQFAVLARDFFSRLSRRQLSYFLSASTRSPLGSHWRAALCRAGPGPPRARSFGEKFIP